MKSNKNHSNDVENKGHDIFGDPEKLGSKPDDQSNTNSFPENVRKSTENLIRQILDQAKNVAEEHGIPEYYNAFLFKMEQIASEENRNYFKNAKSADDSETSSKSEVTIFKKIDRSKMQHTEKAVADSVRHLTSVHEKMLGKPIRKKSIIIDQSGVMRNFTNDSNVCFYSMSDPHFLPINLNPFKIPYGIDPQKWIDMVVSLVAQSFSISNAGEEIFTETVYDLYKNQGIFDHSEADKFGGEDSAEWKKEITSRSEQVTFHKILKWMEAERNEFRQEPEQGLRINFFYKLSVFNRPYSAEYALFSAEQDFYDPNSIGLGHGLDEILEDGRITVFETKGMETRMQKFTEKFVKKGTKLMEDAYETKPFSVHIMN